MDLKEGSFLNIGSGTGYYSMLAGHLLRSSMIHCTFVKCSWLVFNSFTSRPESLMELKFMKMLWDMQKKRVRLTRCQDIFRPRKKVANFQLNTSSHILFCCDSKQHRKRPSKAVWVIQKKLSERKMCRVRFVFIALPSVAGHFNLCKSFIAGNCFDLDARKYKIRPNLRRGRCGAKQCEFLCSFLEVGGCLWGVWHNFKDHKENETEFSRER